MNRDELLTELAMKLEEWPATDMPPPGVPGLWWAEQNCWVCQAKGDSLKIAESDYLARRAELISKPDDADAPEWGDYFSQDCDGYWWCFEYSPNLMPGRWSVVSGRYVMLCKGAIPAGHDWRTTLSEVKRDMSQNEPAMSRNERQLNPPTSSLTSFQGREAALETGICSDGRPCDALAKCSECPNDHPLPRTTFEVSTPEEEEVFQQMDAEKQRRDAQLIGDIKAHSILNAAAQHMDDRAKTYDKPEGERSMLATVLAFNAITGDGHMNSEERGWLFMQILKAVRSQQGAYRADNYEDGAAYVALAGEAAAKERG